MAITDAKITTTLPPGSRNARKLSDGTRPTTRLVPVGPSLVTNGGFETNTAGWAAYTGATIARITSDKKLGVASLDVNQPAANAYGASFGPFSVTPGVAYAFAAWVKKVSGTDPLISLIWYDASDVSITSANTVTTSSTTAWAYLSSVAVAPPNAAQARLYIVFSNTGQAYLDGAAVLPCGVEVTSPITEPTTTGATAGGGFSYDPQPSAVFLADAKVFDMGAQTDGTLADSSYTRVYARRHPFVGDVLLDNGLVRLWIKKAYDRYGHVRMSCYVHGAWQAFVDVGLDTGGDTTAKIESFRVKTASRARVVVETRDQDGNPCTLTMTRGSPFVRADATRLFAADTFMDSEIGSASFRFYAYNASTILRDASVDAAQNIAGSSLTEPYALLFAETMPYLVVMGFPKKPTTLYAWGSPNWLLWRLTGSPAVGTQRTAYYGLLAFPWMMGAACYKEAESATTSGGTVVGDGGASGGNAMRLDANAEYVYYDTRGGVDLPPGDYTLIVRLTTSSAVANDVRMLVKNETDAADLAAVTFTATTSYAYYALDFSIQSTDLNDVIRFLVSKQTAGVANLDVDYFAVIPRKRNASTPDHIHFPRDLARNLLMQTSARESVRKA